MTLEELLDSFRDGYYARNPTLAVNNGLHQYDGALPNFSAEAANKQESWLKQMRELAVGLDEASLDSQQSMLREYLCVVVDTELFNLGTLRVLENNTWYDYLALDPNLYLSRDYGTLEQRMAAYTQHVQALPAALRGMRSLIKPMPSGHAETFCTYLDGLAHFVTTASYEVFADVADQSQQEAMRQANDDASAALADLSRWIERSPRNEEFALGLENLQLYLWSLERISTPVEEIKQLAEEDLAANLEAMRRACAAFAPGRTIQESRELVAARKPAVGPLEAARRQLDDLRRLIVERDIVTIPDFEVIVAESPPHMSSGTAYIAVVGCYEPDQPCYYYISPPDPAWSVADQAAYLQSEADLMTTSTHCVWSGHILEAMLCHRPGNPLAEFTYSYAFCEGWCVYSEEMMLREALDNDPEMAIGQLQNALMGDVRVLASIGLHTGSMTLVEAERMFVDLALCEPVNARLEAIRGSFDPGYLFYTVGKWMVTKLRDDWRALHPEKSLKGFHDAFLSFGDVPIVLLRKVLLGNADDGEPLPQR